LPEPLKAPREEGDEDNSSPAHETNCRRRRTGTPARASQDGPSGEIFVYAAGGYYYPGQDHGKLKDEMRSYIDRGYTVVKKKIGGASLNEDLRRIDSILSVLQDGQKLCVDANGRFDLDTAIRYAKALCDTTCSGTRSRATRSTSSCKPRCATTTRTRWQPAKTCSQCRTRAT
jgi:hypothetical protein